MSILLRGVRTREASENTITRTEVEKFSIAEFPPIITLNLFYASGKLILHEIVKCGNRSEHIRFML